MNGHDARTAGTAEAGRGRMRRRLALTAFLLALIAVGAAVPAPESPLANLTGVKSSHVSGHGDGPRLGE
jgi:hypothetical protein